MRLLKSRVDAWMQAMGLEPSGVVEARRAGFCWDDSDLFAVVDVAAIEDGSQKPKRGTRLAVERSLWETAEYTRGGRDEAEWMERPRFTPEALFAERCHAGSMPRGDDFLKLLEQFARIKECQWARDMLAALSDPDPVEYDLEDYDPDRPEAWLKTMSPVTSG